MIQIYDHTWQLYTRMMRYTARRSEFMPYCVLRPIDEFIQKNRNGSMIDWGCGENNNKLAYNIPTMIGIDRTPEADMYGYPHNLWDDIPRVDSILAINSAHFEQDLSGAVARIMDEKLNDGGEIFFTASDITNRDLTPFSNIAVWEELGEIQYYYHTWDHVEELKEQMYEHIMGDDVAEFVSDVDQNEMYDFLRSRTIKIDPFFGLLRVCIKK